MGICRHNPIYGKENPVSRIPLFFFLPQFILSIVPIRLHKPAQDFISVQESRRHQKHSQRIHPDFHRILGKVGHCYYTEKKQARTQPAEMLLNLCHRIGGQAKQGQDGAQLSNDYPIRSRENSQAQLTN